MKNWFRKRMAERSTRPRQRTRRRARFHRRPRPERRRAERPGHGRQRRARRAADLHARQAERARPEMIRAAGLALLLTGCATCTVSPHALPACPTDMPCIQTDRGAILYLSVPMALPNPLNWLRARYPRVKAVLASIDALCERAEEHFPQLQPGIKRGRENWHGFVNSSQSSMPALRDGVLPSMSCGRSLPQRLNAGGASEPGPLSEHRLRHRLQHRPGHRPVVGWGGRAAGRRCRFCGG